MASNANDSNNNNPSPNKKATPMKELYPNGHCLLARDTPQNKQLFPQGPFGYEGIASTICPSPDQCPYYHYKKDSTSSNKDGTAAADGGGGVVVDPQQNNNSNNRNNVPIHILIASFRDKLCARTLHNALARAANPHRLTFRVIQQTQSGSSIEDDEGCWDRYCAKYNPECHMYEHLVRIIPVDSKESKGPTWARAKLSAMIAWDYTHRHQLDQLDFTPVHIQDFILQIDSHMDFSNDFDVGLIDMFHQTQNDYAVLSTYVADIEQNNMDPPTVPHLCMVTFTSSIRNWGTKECSNLLQPKLTNAMWGAGLSFHRTHAELNVPVDPYLDNVFDGEEGSRGIRLFTHGYDVYTPNKVLVTHDYHGHQENPITHTWGRYNKEVIQESHWKWMDDIEKARTNLSIFGSQRVNMILGIGNKARSDIDVLTMERDLARASRYGLGEKRTLEQAVEFTGIDLENKKMVTNRCGNVLWVPFVESPNYGVGETLSRGNAGETVPIFVVTPDDSSSGSSSQHPFSVGETLSRLGLRSGTRSLTGQATTTSIQGYHMIGGLLLTAVVVARLLQRPRRKDDMYKK